MRLIRNAIRTPDGTVLESTHVHDFVIYTDKNGKTYGVDGGLEYQRLLGDMDDCEILTVDEDSPIIEIREYFKWGTYGKDGKQPQKIVKLSEMSDAHIRAILEGNYSQYVINILKKELLKLVKIKNKRVLK